MLTERLHDERYLKNSDRHDKQTDILFSARAYVLVLISQP